jgi:hypothetical protein
MSLRQTDDKPAPAWNIEPVANGLSRVELPDGRVLAFHDAQVVGFNLFEAQRRASRGARARSQAVAGLYSRDDGTWEVSDPLMELDFVGDLAAGVLLANAALEGLADDLAVTDWSSIRGELWEKLVRLRGLRAGLVSPRPVAEDPGIFGLLMRGDADTCAEDAIALVRALRPELAPEVLLQSPIT